MRLDAAGGTSATDELAIAAFEAAGAIDAVALPPPVLDGWESLCAAEYAAAVARVQAGLADASAAVRRAVVLLRSSG